MRRALLGLIVVACAARVSSAQRQLLVEPRELSVLVVSPQPLSVVPVGAAVTVLFDKSVRSDSIDAGSFRVSGEVSGPAAGVYAFTDANRRVTFVPAQPFAAGEVVKVTLSHGIRAFDRTRLRHSGHAFDFRADVQSSSLQFVQALTLPNFNTPRIVALDALDANGDLYPDLVMVGRATEEVRTFLHSGSGLSYELYLPSSVLGLEEPERSKLEDLNGDGVLDLCIGTRVSGIYSLLGSSNGLFAPLQQLPENADFEFLDWSGDGRPDLVSHRFGEMHLYRNSGNGEFSLWGTPPSVSPTANGVKAGDMNGDGITDLVVLDEERLRTLIANGDGTFTPAGLVSQITGGDPGEPHLADMDSDGDVDVCIQSGGVGGLMRNLGNGVFSSVSVIHPGATLGMRVGDLDADGDLDWLFAISNIGYRAFFNDGSGSLASPIEVPSKTTFRLGPLLDADLDGDLDFAGYGNLADDILIFENQ